MGLHRYNVTYTGEIVVQELVDRSPNTLFDRRIFLQILLETSSVKGWNGKLHGIQLVAAQLQRGP